MPSRYSNFRWVLFSMGAVMERYVPDPLRSTRIGSAHLEIVDFQWLQDMIEGRSQSFQGPGAELARTGLLTAIRGGRVVSAAAV
jgi:hypothetical protein